MTVPDDAPPLAIYSSPYGGLGLKTRSYPAARARIAGLLANATEVEHATAELGVHEPCSRALVESLVGPFDRDTAMRGGGRRMDLAEAVTTAGHAHDAVAGEAWRSFGTPHAMNGVKHKTGWYVEWRWQVEDDAALAPRRLEDWSPFATAHDQLQYDDYASTVTIRAIWELRLRVAGDRVVAAPYPRSRIHAHLSGRHASAFFDLVLPHASASAAFLADYQAVNRALGMTVPMGGYKLCAPKKRGGGRSYRRLPDA